MPDEKQIFFNGIDGVTGEYLVPPMQISTAAVMASGEVKEKKIITWLTSMWHKISTPFMGLPLGVDPTDITQAGWGIVFLKDEDPAVKAALQPLVEHRSNQIVNSKLIRVLEYQPGETWEQWLGRYNVAPGSVEPTKIPYYLLLIGDPQRLSFSLGHLLDVEYGIGRLHFDTPAEYAAYAASVIAYESDTLVPNAKEAVFFGPRHNFDQATKMSADYLINPLADGYPAQNGNPAEPGTAQRWGYQSRKIWGDAATKAALLDVIQPVGSSRTPAFLFSASHGMGFPRGNNNQKNAQGALLCQDWPGFGTIHPNHYLAAADVPANSRLHGMVLFHFACYGAGTPQVDQFIHEPGQPPPTIADASFLSALPKTWLTHPNGSALACIGHVERAWGTSIIASHAGPQIQTFQNAIGRILIGQPLGYALKDFNERYAALSTSMAAILQQAGWGAAPDPESLAYQWIERNDAEGYILIGDPAVKLRVNDLVN
jgi:hypothetical protein